MDTATKSNGENGTQLRFYPGIPGLEHLLLQSEVAAGGEERDRAHFDYYAESGLNIVIYGPPGVGKTILALQMAMAGLRNRNKSRKVVYLTKDTPSEALLGRLHESFSFFEEGTWKEERLPEARDGREDRLGGKRNRDWLRGFTDGRTCQRVALLGLAVRKEEPEDENSPPPATPQEILKGLADGPFLALADFSESSAAQAFVDKYSVTSSVFRSLGHLQPRLRSVFDAMEFSEYRADGKRGIRGWERDMVIVCDSLPPRTLEEHLRLQTQHSRRDGENRRQGEEKECQRKPIFIFVMESSDLPQTMSVAFPPDVQIKLGSREETNGVSTRTIRLLKTRFQKSLDEETPFIIVGKDDACGFARERVLRLDGTGNRRPFFEDAHPEPNRNGKLDPIKFAQRRVGIEIMPPLAQEASAFRECVPTRPPMAIRFGVDRLDAFTEERELAGGGVTLLATHNRCASTALSLHYLLGQVGEAARIDGEELRFLESVAGRAAAWVVRISNRIEALPDRLAGRTALPANGQLHLALAFFGSAGTDGASSTQDWEKARDGLFRFVVQSESGIPRAHRDATPVTASFLPKQEQAPNDETRGEERPWRTRTREEADRCVAAWYEGWRNLAPPENATELVTTLRTQYHHLRERLFTFLDFGHAVPRSVLHVSFSGDVADILHSVWRHPLLRAAVWAPSTDGVEHEREKTAWKELAQAIEAEMQSGAGVSVRDRLYKIPLKHRHHHDLCHTCQELSSYLYIYVPDFAWITAEEAIDRIARLLTIQRHDKQCARGEDGTDMCRMPCINCLQIDRVVIDRVGRLPARWPLIENREVFFSTIASLCAQHAIELMLIDDTIEENDATGAFRSHWISIAQNIIRLRRIPFHGSEAMTVQLVRAAGRLVTKRRLEEIVFEHGVGGFDDTMTVQDSFRGYTGVSIGKPERCKLIVDLSYDEERTPLHRDVYATKKNIESTMDSVEVRMLGPKEWSGINSAFHNLSGASRDDCHVVAIDGIWLHSLLDQEALHRLTREELRTVLPNYAYPHNDEKVPDKKLEDHLSSRYVTQSMTVALAKLKYALKDAYGTHLPKNPGDGLHFAVPMRHNWGVLAIARPSKEFMERAFRELLRSSLESWDAQTQQSNAALCQGLKKLIALKATGRQNPEEAVIRGVLGLLLGAPDLLGSDSERREEYVGRVYAKLWGSPPWPSDTLGPLQWRDLANFRIHFWHPFWRGGWVERCLTELTGKQGMNSDLWFSLFPRVDLFDFALTTEESIVAFLLELLLAETKKQTLFGPETERTEVDVPGQDMKLSLLTFRTDQEAQEEFIKALVLLYRLLSSSQRRLVGIGVRTEHTDIGMIRRNRLGDSNTAREAFSDWPHQIALFSRQWITTVRDLLPRYDLREQIRLSVLPTGPACENYWTEELRLEEHGGKLRLTEQQQRYGPTVAGTWYLGILRGGNTDVGIDVMKEILSEGHELGHLLGLHGAPVSTRYYGEDLIGTEEEPSSRDGEAELPYADVVRELYVHEKGGGSLDGADGAAKAPPEADPTPRAESKGGDSDGDDKQEETTRHRVFPFYRTRIINYLGVSAVLYDLVRHVMRLQIDEAELRSDRPEGEPSAAYRTWTANIRSLVHVALQRIAKLQPEQEEGATRC